MAGSRNTLFPLFVCSALGVAGTLMWSTAAPAADEVQNAATTQASPVPDTLRPISQQQLDAASGDASSWLQSNGSYAETRYAPGAQINTANVSKLKPLSSSRRR